MVARPSSQHNDRENAGPPVAALPHHYLQLLRQVPEIRHLWSAFTLSTFGDAVQFTAVLWLAAQAASPGVGVAVFVVGAAAPVVLVGPWAGVVADSVQNRRRLLIGADIGRAALALAVPAAFGVHLVVAVAVIVAMATLSVLFSATHRAAVPEVVGASRLLPVNSLLTAGGQFATLAGAAAGGWLLSIGEAVPFATNAATFALSALLVGRIAVTRFKIPQHGSPIEGSPVRSGVVHRLREGWATVRGNPALGRILVIGTVATAAFAPAPVALVVLVESALHGDSGTFGALQATTAAGLAGGSLLIGRLRPARPVLAMGVGLIALAVATAGLGLAQAIWLAGIWVLLRGAANGVTSVLTGTLVQQLATAETRGRVLGLAGSAFELPRLAVLPVAGLLIDGAGPRAVLLGMALVLAVAAALAWPIRTCRPGSECRA